MVPRRSCPPPQSLWRPGAMVAPFGHRCGAALPRCHPGQAVAALPGSVHFPCGSGCSPWRHRGLRDPVRPARYRGRPAGDDLPCPRRSPSSRAAESPRCFSWGSGCPVLVAAPSAHPEGFCAATSDLRKARGSPRGAWAQPLRRAGLLGSAGFFAWEHWQPEASSPPRRFCARRPRNHCPAGPLAAGKALRLAARESPPQPPRRDGHRPGGCLALAVMALLLVTVTPAS